MQTINSAFQANVKESPNKIAIYCEKEAVSYKELSSKVDIISDIMVKHGVKYGDRVGVLLPNNITHVALIFAAAKLGITIVPLSPTLPLSAIDKALKHAEVKHIIGTEYTLESLTKNQMPYLDGLWLCLEGRLQNTVNYIDQKDKVQEAEIVCPHTRGDEPLILTMTSGSTGEPKPITLSQKNKIDRAFSAAELYKITKDDTILAATPLYHSLAERLVILPLLIGATAVLMPRFTPVLWLNCIKDHGVTFTIAVSSQLNQIAEVLTSPFLPEIASLRCVVSSSALLENHVKTALVSKLQCDLHECYGTTEVAIATNINFSESKDKLKSVGKAIPGVDIKILKSDETLAEIGEIGEIICKTPMIFAGYYGQPELTKEAFHNDYFLTGDLGYLDAAGYLYFVGRKKDLIITGGINVYPQDIESVILELPTVKECVAFSYPDQRLGEIVAVAIVPKEKELSIREIKIHCAKRLGDFQQPMKYFIVDNIPKNDMGKIAKVALADSLINL